MIYIKLTRVNNEHFYCVAATVTDLILYHSKIHLDFLVKITIPCEEPSLMLGSAIKSE